jgi:SAM-dependent methyltransferase
MLTPEAGERLGPFIADYRAIREAEGRGGDADAWFRMLPDVAASDPFAHEWRIRAASFRALVGKVLAPMEAAIRSPLIVLDLGAGVGWLANRLAERGHLVAGVDLSDDARDGLGAWSRYATRWLPVQAEFDRLPVADRSADLVIFDASLHYSTDIEATLTEALRVVRTLGRVVVVDTPVYRSEGSGRQMLAGRATTFERAYGRRSDSLPVEGFLTEARLGELGERLGVTWTRAMPWYGLGFALRPWRARLRGRREPARFPILSAARPDRP